MIKLIFAATSKGVIGNNNKLPWKIEKELKHFASYTKNSSLFVGSNTLISMSKSFVKKDRKIYSFLTNDQGANKLIDTLLETEDDIAKMFIEARNDKFDLCIIGGKTIYQKYWFLADEICFSLINKNYKGNIVFKTLLSALIDINYMVEKNEEFTIYKRNLNTDPIWIWYDNYKISSKELKEHYFKIKNNTLKY